MTTITDTAFEARIWVCPALCGCAIRMVAQWPEPARPDGVNTRHPYPFTARHLTIVRVCAAHEHLQHLGVATDPWPDRPEAGYLRRPIPNASRAESLYVHLWRFNGQRDHDPRPCGCRRYFVADELAGTVTDLAHPDAVHCEAHR